MEIAPVIMAPGFAMNATAKGARAFVAFKLDTPLSSVGTPIARLRSHDAAVMSGDNTAFLPSTRAGEPSTRACLSSADQRCEDG